MNYDEAIDWLYGTQLFGIKLGLDPVGRLLDELGVPVERTPGRRIVHVAGTNGKGSVCAMVESIARHAGRRTALFTSPHLVDFGERIRVDGECIGKEEIAGRLADLRRRVEGWETHPTFFEITLALAAWHFTDRQADLWVLETGMGGRLDATNVFESDVAVLTPIGLDHQQWLGETLAEIAAEKAGIIKPGATVLSAVQPPEALEVIRERCPAVEIVHRPLDPDVADEIGLRGPHQRDNAALAVAVARAALGEDLDPAAVRRGLAEVEWPGRFQVLDDGCTVLDGAHNPAAARVLVATWREQFGDARPTVIMGAVGTKDVEGLLRELGGVAGAFVFVPIRSQRGLDPSDLVARVGALGLPQPVSMAGSLRDAFDACRDHPHVLICGSLFLVGEALSLHRSGRSIRETEQ